ncbi:MAG: pyridoxal 5'-phosphate synthase [Myxococcota bacterium]
MRSTLAHDALVDRVSKELDRAKEALPERWSRFALATLGLKGPDVRYLLLKAFDERGFVFFTHHMSRKGRQLAASREAAMAFHWFETGCQLRARGPVAPISAAESDAYFAKRDRLKQLGAWASRQSRAPLEPLTERVSAAEARFEGSDVPRPDHWGGYRLRPTEIELWYDGEGRLHERTRYTRDALTWWALPLDP